MSGFFHLLSLHGTWQKFILLCKVPSLCFLQRLRFARRRQELDFSKWFRGVVDSYLKVKQECASHCPSVNAWCQAGAPLPHKVPSHCFSPSLFLLVVTKSCVSDIGSGALPNPVYETMGTRRNPPFVNGWHLGVPSMRGITVALLFA